MILFDGGKEILATFGDKLSAARHPELQRTGVEIQTETIVQNVDATGVEVRGADGTSRGSPASTKIWAAGVAASPLARMLADATGAECDRAGRIEVLPDCSLPGHPEVFAVGDMMSLNGLPGVAEVAMQTGIHAARTISGGSRAQEPSRSSTATWAAWRRCRAAGRSSASAASGCTATWAGWRG